MFDLYLFNTIINVLWYLFTVLFVLYRYTKFFSYIYNFVKFCGKLVTGASYVYSFINPVPQVDLEAQYLQENRNNRKTLYSKCKGYIVKNYNYYYRKIFKTGNEYNECSELTANRNNQTVFPLVETNYGSGIEFSTQLHKSNDKLRENDLFNKKFQELEVSELEMEEHNCYIKNEDDTQDSNNYIFRIGETTSNLKDKILLNENFKTDYIKSRESKENVNLDEFYSDSDIEINSDTELPSNLFM